MQLATKRFLLRDFTSSDESSFLNYHRDPRSIQFYQPHEATRAHTEQLLTTFRTWAREVPRRNFQLAVTNRLIPQELIGCVGLRTAGISQDMAEFGIELAPQFWGRFGYAIEISDAMISTGFTRLGVTAITGTIVSGNIRATRLAQWFGADITSLEVEDNSANKSTLDESHWRLTRNQWENHERRSASNPTDNLGVAPK